VSAQRARIDMITALASAARQGDKRAIGRLLSLAERGPRHDPALAAERHAALVALDAGGIRRALLLGITGPPGAGKSTLVGALGPALVAAGRSVAVLAIDPSSPRSGGALLGDRVRAAFPAGERRLFFRSQASAGQLGGLAATTMPVLRVLERLHDLVLIETVGVGQSEIDVCAVADHTLLVTTPASGDRLQGLKAGIMELVQAVCLNKNDLPGAGRAQRELAAALVATGRPAIPVFAVSARAPASLATLVTWILALPEMGAEAWRQHRVAAIEHTLRRRFGDATPAITAPPEDDSRRAAADPAWDDLLEDAMISKALASMRI
jgi:LAO/AO transport system kinase